MREEQNEDGTYKKFIHPIGAELAPHLGKDWVNEPTEHNHWFRIIHKPSGLTLNCRPEHWKIKDKYYFSIAAPQDERGSSMSFKDWGFDIETEAGISKNKSMEQVAKELTRRLLNDGIPAAIGAREKLEVSIRDQKLRNDAFSKACESCGLEWTFDRNRERRASGYVNGRYTVLMERSNGFELHVDNLTLEQVRKLGEAVGRFKAVKDE